MYYTILYLPTSVEVKIIRITGNVIDRFKKSKHPLHFQNIREARNYINFHTFYFDNEGDISPESATWETNAWKTGKKIKKYLLEPKEYKDEA